MAYSFTCDGCGKSIARGEPVHCFGHAIKRDYCDDCEARVEEYMAALECAHYEAAKFYQQRRASLIESIKAQLPNIKLPDLA